MISATPNHAETSANQFKKLALDYFMPGWHEHSEA